MSIYVLKDYNGRVKRFQTFSPERLFVSGRIAREPIPERIMNLAKHLKKNETPGLNVVLTYEPVKLRGLFATRWSLGRQGVIERLDQIKIGLKMPMEIFRGRLNYILNGHHRGVALLEHKEEMHTAFVISTDKETETEKNHYDPLSSGALPYSLWNLKKEQDDDYEPWEKRISNFEEKLGKLYPTLAKEFEQVPSSPSTRGMRDLAVKLLSFDDFEKSIEQFNDIFGLSLSDLQLICMMRDAMRRKVLFDRLSRINSSDQDSRLRRKINGFLTMARLISKLGLGRIRD
ncbi:hypothetical protein AMJ44_04020 [candidate division WOR-1 bacterium DG_54_3]|uniref:ParB/Sulfiredoxin domain-containing protein n=1 Tax=candidate division WOR-1 bacterium DG_54_3 TaxID=1703775 RepID=A0A0S7Y4F8_UNCSA|nr:MAG: hypothetical protein AMJ44_04020 [candidate division WOR-1 bacterium DG_54_3]